MVWKFRLRHGGIWVDKSKTFDGPEIWTVWFAPSDDVHRLIGVFETETQAIEFLQRAYPRFGAENLYFNSYPMGWATPEIK